MKQTGTVVTVSLGTVTVHARIEWMCDGRSGG